MRKKPLSVTVPLPSDYHKAVFMAFHSRDSEEIAERVTPRGVEKGMVWAGKPACLRLAVRGGKITGSLAVDGDPGADAAARLHVLVRHMFGLDQPVERFEAAFAAHAELGPLLARSAGLRVPQTATPFEALCWAVIGQLISVSAAVSIRRRFIQAAGMRHSGGLFCFPDAPAVACMDAAVLRETGLSRSKAGALLALGEAVASGDLALDALAANLASGAMHADALRAQLLAVKGIGPWTVSYALLRGFAWLDGSLHGDVAVRRNLTRLLGREEPVNEKETEVWLAPFAPFRALAAVHLWNMQAVGGY